MDGKKHICLIYEFLSEQGGLEREIINHANFLKEEGYEVTILTCHKSKDIEKLLPFDGLEIKEITTFKTPIQPLNLALCFLGLNNLKKYNPDIFLSYSAPANFLIRNKKTKKVNYVNHYPKYLYLKPGEMMEWANTFERKVAITLSLLFGNYLRRLDKKLIRKNDVLFANSLFTKKKLDPLYGTDMIVSYPPIDPKIKPSKSKFKEKFIFSCGRIIPDKKFEWLIESASFTKNNFPIYLAGQGDEKYIESLTNLAKKLNVKLVFLGKLDTENIVKYYSSAEVFAFPTPGEDFGLVPAESLSCGTPVVVWGDGSGPTEQVINNINGFHAKLYDLKDFADKLDLVIGKKLKQKNKKKILKSAERFSYENVRKGFIKKIRELQPPT